MELKSYLNNDVTSEWPDTLAANFEETGADANLEDAEYKDKAENAYQNAVGFLKQIATTATGIEDVKNKNLADKTQTKAAAKVNTAKYAQKKEEVIDKLAGNTSRPSDTVEQIRNSIKREKVKVAKQPFAREARDRLANMEPDKARDVVRNAINNDNKELAKSVLGAPQGFLSNIDEETFQGLNELYDAKYHEADMQACASLEHVESVIDSTYSAFKQYTADFASGLQDTISKSMAAQEAMNK